MPSELDKELERLHELWQPIQAIAAIRPELDLSIGEAKDRRQRLEHAVRADGRGAA